MENTMTEQELHDFLRAIRREAHILRSGAGGNRVANQVAAKLIAMTGGEAAAAFDEQTTRERIMQAVGR